MADTKDFKISSDMALLIGRIGFGGSMLIAHGWPKISNFSSVTEKFPALFGMSSATCLGLAVFAEVFCAVLLIIGLGTRFALSQLVLTMAVGMHFHINVLNQQLFDSPGKPSAELALIYLIAYVMLFILGPGRISLDAVIKEKRKNSTAKNTNKNKTNK